MLKHDVDQNFMLSLIGIVTFMRLNSNRDERCSYEFNEVLMPAEGPVYLNFITD